MSVLINTTVFHNLTDLMPGTKRRIKLQSAICNQLQSYITEYHASEFPKYIISEIITSNFKNNSE